MLLQGKAFVFTGKLEKYTRDEAQRRVEDLGGRASPSVSKETDWVVVGEAPGSKLQDAKNQHETLDEDEFERMVNPQA